MTSPSPRTSPDGRFCRCIAVTTIVAIYISLICGQGGATAMMLAAQGADGATHAAPAHTTAHSHPPNHPPGKSSQSQIPPSPFGVKSKIALVVDANTAEEILAKDADRVVPIASITKLMTAIVVIDAKPPMGEILKVSDDDRDLVMGTSS